MTAARNEAGSFFFFLFSREDVVELPCAAGTAGIKCPEHWRCLNLPPGLFCTHPIRGGFPGAVSGRVPTCGGFSLL